MSYWLHLFSLKQNNYCVQIRTRPRSGARRSDDSKPVSHCQTFSGKDSFFSLWIISVMFALSSACLPLLLYEQISRFDFQILDSAPHPPAALEAVSSTEEFSPSNVFCCLSLLISFTIQRCIKRWQSQGDSERWVKACENRRTFVVSIVIGNPWSHWAAEPSYFSCLTCGTQAKTTTWYSAALVCMKWTVSDEYRELLFGKFWNFAIAGHCPLSFVSSTLSCSTFCL